MYYYIYLGNSVIIVTEAYFIKVNKVDCEILEGSKKNRIWITQERLVKVWKKFKFKKKMVPVVLEKLYSVHIFLIQVIQWCMVTT